MTPIEALDAALLRIMRQGTTTPFQERVNALAPALDQALNLSYILRISIGARWSTLTPEEQQRLVAVFRQYTIATYVEAFDSYNGQRIALSPQTRPLSDGAQVVRSEIIPTSGTAHYIDYVMRRSEAGRWLATDVLADGTISRVAVLRSDFSSMLARGGASALEASLQRKTAALANG
ncbi:MAG: ABC transporter substrate-binding protein [Pseudomonadota bacterium]|nr:ABC transporter substrate-binding protein [Pseudomonadota bacterium]